MDEQGVQILVKLVKEQFQVGSVEVVDVQHVRVVQQFENLPSDVYALPFRIIIHPDAFFSMLDIAFAVGCMAGKPLRLLKCVHRDDKVCGQMNSVNHGRSHPEPTRNRMENKYID